MRGLWREILMAIGMGMILPGIVLNFGVRLGRERVNTVTEFTTEVKESSPEETSVQIGVRREDGSIEQMDLNAYITGVVLGEMPAYFHEEALKAQSVVARTYAMRAAVTGGKHGDGCVCTEASCCQAYVTEEAYLQKGGTEDAVEKVRSAVHGTSGYVLTYEGDLIEATYFSCSGGRTEDAVAVWGTDVPYLRATESPGEEDAAHYTDSLNYSIAEFCSRLDLPEDAFMKEPFGKVTYTAGGGVDTIRIGNKTFSGTELRKKLDLRSTNVRFACKDGNVVITTKGFGHRVGMSQYGADAMAETGADYREILSHYYQGTELTDWEN